MKKILIVVLLLVAALGYTQTLTYTDAATLSWDAIATLEDGSPIPAGDVIEYEVGRSVYPIADRLIPEVIEGLTLTPGMAISVPQDGNTYGYALRTKRTTDGGATVLISAWNWSDVNGLETPQPFLFKGRSVVPPSIPLGFSGS